MPESVVSSNTKLYNASVVVTSDSCYEDPSQDESGLYVVQQLKLTSLFDQVHKTIVRDDEKEIINALEASLAQHDPALIITIGGTGLCPSDVTPEATSSLYERQCSGISTALHLASLRHVPHAALSRLTSGIVGATLIINFPGKLKACMDCFGCLSIILEHALEQVRFNKESYTATHKKQHGLPSSKPGSLLLKAPNGRQVSLRISSSPCSSVSKSDAINLTKNHNMINASNGPPHRKPASQTDLKSSKFTIQAIQESRKDIELLSNNSCQSESGFTTQDALSSTCIDSNDTQARTKLPPIKVLQTESAFPQISFKQCLDTLAIMAYNLLDSPVEVSFTTPAKAYNCLGCMLAQDITPKRVVPPYAVSSMDGYVLNIPLAMKSAIKSTRTFPPARLVSSLEEFELYQKNPAQANRFFCYQVNTGGRLPRYGYAVVPAEKASQPTNGQVQIYEVKQGAYVRRPGTDIDHEDSIKAGTIIGPVELSSIMAMGHKKVALFERPKLGLLSTGVELENFFTAKTIGEYSVVDTNQPLLTSMFRTRGYFVFNCGVAKDEPDHILAAIEEGLKKCDVLVITGGASMGSRNHVKDVIQHMGGTIHFRRVSLKPGKPASFASIMAGSERRKFIFSLPGNPVSAYITALVLVIPFLEHGINNHYRPDRPISLDSIGELINAEVGKLIDEGQHTFDGRYEFVRAKITSKKGNTSDGDLRTLYTVEVSVKQHSSRMLNLVNCDCLLMIDPSLRGRSLSIGQIYPALKLHRVKF